MKKAKFVVSVLLVVFILLSFSGCSSVPLLKGGEFSAEYKSFIRNMQKKPPVSVAFEQYLKKDGFDKDKLIVDADAQRIQMLVKALANVQITQKVESASNFAIRHYTFTDEKGAAFTFEFYGSYLKAEGKFYKTENSLPFISIRLQESKSGDFVAALDELYDGSGEFAGKLFLSCRLLEEKDGGLRESELGDFELSREAKVIAPVSHEDFSVTKSVSVEEFYADYEQIKGQDNANYIFKITLENGVITAMQFDLQLSERGEF